MINSFLVTLHNSGTAPINGSSTVGNILWPSNYEVKAYTGAAAFANRILFLDEADAFKHFLKAVQLLWVVEESVCADNILQDDGRTSYDRAQLLGQFQSIAGVDYQHLSNVLAQFDQMKALEFLPSDLKAVYRSALSRLDKLAVIICYFGLRDAY